MRTLLVEQVNIIEKSASRNILEKTTIASRRIYLRKRLAEQVNILEKAASRAGE